MSDFQTVFTIVYRMIRRLHKKKIFREKKYFPAARVVLFYLTRPTGNDFLLKGGLRHLTVDVDDVCSNPIGLE